MKKSLTKVLGIFLSMLLLAGCGSNKTTEQAANTDSDEAAVTEAPTVAAEADASADKEGFTIAGIYKMGDATWFIQEGDASQAVIEKAGGTFMYMDAKQDSATFLEMIDNCIAQKVDGVLACIPDQNLSQAVVDKLTEANIPVIAVDDALQTTDGTLLAPWVGIDGYNIGTSVGEWAVDYVNNNSLAADEEFGIMLLTADTVSSCVPRTEGQLAAIQEGLPDFPEARIFRADHDTSSEQGNSAASAVITGNPQITKWLVLAVSDEGAVGASRALETAGLAANSCCVGLGGYLAPDEFSKDGSPFKAAAYFSANGVGGTAAQEMVDFLQNKTEIPEKFAVSAEIVEPDDDLASIMPEYMK